MSGIEPNFSVSKRQKRSLKPSRKRMVKGDRAEDPIGISVMHCTARSVRDSAALFALTERQGADAVFAPVGHVTGPSKRRLRVGLVTKSAAGLPADPEVEALILAQAKLLRELGHQVVETAWPVEGGQFTHDFLLYWAAGAAKSAQEIGQALGHAPDATVLEPFSLGMAGMVVQAKPGELGAASQRLVQAVSAYAAWFKDLDVVLSPVLRTPPPVLGCQRRCGLPHPCGAPHRLCGLYAPAQCGGRPVHERAGGAGQGRAAGGGAVRRQDGRRGRSCV